MTQRRRRRLTRDTLFPLLGAGGFLYLLHDGGERTTYMMACLALMGVSIPLRRDRKRKDDEDP